MKKHILKLLALALCAVSLLSLTALAEEAVSPEEADTEKTTAEDELPAAPAAVQSQDVEFSHRMNERFGNFDGLTPIKGAKSG